MAEIGISQAAKLVGKTRNTLYRLMKEGQLSFRIGSSGTRTVDTAELLRVFPYAAKNIGQSDKSDTLLDTKETGKDNEITNVTPDKDELIQLLKTQLAEAATRETWLKERIEALEKRLPLPPGQEAQEEAKPEKQRGFWARLFRL